MEVGPQEATTRDRLVLGQWTAVSTLGDRPASFKSGAVGVGGAPNPTGSSPAGAPPCLPHPQLSTDRCRLCPLL